MPCLASEWVIFNEFVLTTEPYIRTVTEIRPEWCVNGCPSICSIPDMPA